MNECICVNCPNKCYEYENNSTSDKAYYEWTCKAKKINVSWKVRDLNEKSR